MEATIDSVKREARTNTLRGRRITSTSDDIRATCIVVFRATIIVLSVEIFSPSLHRCSLDICCSLATSGKTQKKLPKEPQ